MATAQLLSEYSQGRSFASNHCLPAALRTRVVGLICRAAAMARSCSRVIGPSDSPSPLTTNRWTARRADVESLVLTGSVRTDGAAAGDLRCQRRGARVADVPASADSGVDLVDGVDMGAAGTFCSWTTRTGSGSGSGRSLT